MSPVGLPDQLQVMRLCRLWRTFGLALTLLTTFPSWDCVPADRLPWSGGTVRVFIAYTVVHNVSANIYKHNTKYIQ